jgi:coxsackievirus/adenovirus receptor
MAKSTVLGLLVLAGLTTITTPQQPDLEFDPNHYRPAASPCYNHAGSPQRCVPDFINAAFNLHVDSTDTCGERGPTKLA